MIPEYDVRVSPTQSYILERALNSLGIPTKLLILPDAPHPIGHNPWYEKLKLREELKWLHKYGTFCLSACNDTLSSAACNEQMQMHTLIFAVLLLLVWCKTLSKGGEEGKPFDFCSCYTQPQS